MEKKIFAFSARSKDNHIGLYVCGCTQDLIGAFAPVSLRSTTRSFSVAKALKYINPSVNKVIRHISQKVLLCK